jgi:hypothetical protein
MPVNYGDRVPLSTSPAVLLLHHHTRSPSPAAGGDSTGPASTVASSVVRLFHFFARRLLEHTLSQVAAIL